uniref:Uncharacterized protein n=1 Tax=viral metagenome TaxID=1070528 RepID=A0A6C0EZI0_9ZZZZ
MEIANMPIDTMSTESLGVETSIDDPQIVIKEYYPKLHEEIIKLNNFMLAYEELVTDNSGFLDKYHNLSNITSKSQVFDDLIYISRLSSKLKCVLNIIIAAKDLIYNYKKLQNIKNIDHQSILKNYNLYLDSYYDYIIEHKINIDSQKRYVNSITIALFSDKP